MVCACAQWYPNSHVCYQPSTINSLLWQDFPPDIEAGIKFGADFIEKIGLDGFEHFAERFRFLEPADAYVIGACRIEGAYVGQKVGDRDNLCLGINLTEVPDEFRVRCAFEQRVVDGANQDFSRRHTGMDQGFRMADVPVDHFDASLPEGCMDIGIEIDHGNFSKKV